jgi:hypothetical protein
VKNYPAKKHPSEDLSGEESSGEEFFLRRNILAKNYPAKNYPGEEHSGEEFSSEELSGEPRTPNPVYREPSGNFIFILKKIGISPNIDPKYDITPLVVLLERRMHHIWNYKHIPKLVYIWYTLVYSIYR